MVHLVLLLGHHVEDGVDNDSGPVDDVGDDVDVRVFVALIKLAIIKVSNRRSMHIYSDLTVMKQTRAKILFNTDCLNSLE